MLFKKVFCMAVGEPQKVDISVILSGFYVTMTVSRTGKHSGLGRHWSNGCPKKPKEKFGRFGEHFNVGKRLRKLWKILWKSAGFLKSWSKYRDHTRIVLGGIKLSDFLGLLCNCFARPGLLLMGSEHFEFYVMQLPFRIYFLLLFLIACIFPAIILCFPPFGKYSSYHFTGTVG